MRPKIKRRVGCGRWLFIMWSSCKQSQCGVNCRDRIIISVTVKLSWKETLDIVIQFSNMTLILKRLYWRYSAEHEINPLCFALLHHALLQVVGTVKLQSVRSSKTYWPIRNNWSSLKYFVVALLDETDRMYEKKADTLTEESQKRLFHTKDFLLI